MIIDGVEYTDKELSFLRQYTCRKLEDVDYNYGQRGWGKTNKKFNVNPNSYNVINSFLGTNGLELPYDVLNGDQLKEFLEGVETLFTVACKYGKTHEIPEKLYREDGYMDDILNAKQQGYSVPLWYGESFKSFSKNDYEIETFRRENSQKIIMNSGITRYLKTIPFIDVNQILGTSHIFSDEKEIILPPFFIAHIDKTPLDKSDDEKRGYFELSASDEMYCPEKREEISDSELCSIVKLFHKKDKSPEELAEQEELCGKMLNSLNYRFKDIYMTYMKDNLIDYEVETISIIDVVKDSILKGVTETEVNLAKSQYENDYSIKDKSRGE